MYALGLNARVPGALAHGIISQSYLKEGFDEFILRNHITESYHSIILRSHVTELYYRIISWNHITEIYYRIKLQNHMMECCCRRYIAELLYHRDISQQTHKSQQISYGRHITAYIYIYVYINIYI